MATRSDARDQAKTSTPRYMQLADSLREQILSGELPANDQFPTENALCREHGVSRFTVREALRRLQSEGLIARRRGSGTVVQPAAARGGALHQPLSNVGEILQYARDARIEFTQVGSVKLPKAIADHIAEPTRGKWLNFRGIRRKVSDNTPIAVTDAYILGSIGDSVDFDISRETLFRQIEDATGEKLARVTQDIQAVAANAEYAEALGIGKRAACLRILRCYYDTSEKLFEISVSHHPGNRFAYSMHIDIDG